MRSKRPDLFYQIANCITSYEENSLPDQVVFLKPGEKVYVIAKSEDGYTVGVYDGNIRFNLGFRGIERITENEACDLTMSGLPLAEAYRRKLKKDSHA
jgi:hypothetical protein